MEGVPHRQGWRGLLPAAGLLLCLAPSHGTAVGACTGFRPARFDMRGAPPGIARPIAALPGDFNRDGLSDVAVVNKFIDGFLQDGSISVLTGAADGSLTLASTRITEGFFQWAAAGDFDQDGVPDVAGVTVRGALIFLGDGAGAFHPPASIPLPFDPIHVSVADMNADQRSDLVVVQQYIGQPTGRVTVLLGDGAGGFTARPPSPVGQDPRAAVAADFNRDGRLDVVTGNNLSSNITFLPGLGDGTFGPGQNTPLGASGGFPAAADFNRDGKLDLIVSSETIASPAVTLLGGGDGTFILNGTFALGDTPRNPVLCDFDRNGTLDVAVPNSGTGDISVLFGDGAGSFAGPINIGTDGGPAQASLHDFNGDGFCDLVTANERTNSVSVLLGGPRGTLGTPTITAGRAPVGAATADFNRDGNPDLAVANRDDSTVMIFRGDGEGGMFLSQTLSVGTNPGAVAAADLNTDGAVDLVVANQGIAGSIQNDTIDVLQNDTTGGFFVAYTMTVGDVPLDVKTGDFDGDGRPDIAVANSQSDKISFFFNEAPNGFSNIKNIRIARMQRSLAVADYNGDGFLDVAIAVMNQNSILPLLGTSGGGFQEAALIQLGGTSRVDQIAVGHLDGDSIPDLLVISQPSDIFAPGELTTLIGNGDATFREPYPRLATGLVPEAVAIVDLDRIGGVDAVVSNRLNNDVMTFSGDGAGRLTPMSDRFGIGNGPIYLVSADFNGDFRIDLASVDFAGNDVTILLNNFPIADQVPDLEFADDSLLRWSPVAGADPYRVYRGLLSVLDADNYGQCLAPSVSSPQLADETIPPPGDGHFYLVSVVSGGVEGPLGYSSDCLSRPNFNPCFVP